MLVIKKTLCTSVPTLLEQKWQKRLLNYERLFVGYSGGLDSTVLLETLAADVLLKDKLTVIHVHHGISPNADQWLQHCKQYCHALQLPFISERVQIAAGANLEERARVARYQVFEPYIQSHTALILAHHQDDQSETVLLNLLRGAGVDGLSAMPEERLFSAGVILRPFLHQPRLALEAYASTHQLKWIEDETNECLDWSRAYLRHQIIPKLRKKWPSASAAIAMNALHCQQSKRILDHLAWQDYPQMTTNSLDCHSELLSDQDRFQNVLRVWLKYHLSYSPSSEHIRQIFDTVISARPDALPCVHLGEFELRRYQAKLYLIAKQNALLKPRVWTNFPKPLCLSDTQKIMALPSNEGLSIDPSNQIEIKFRQGGETFHWHGQSKCLKKLFQYWGIPPWQRSQIPLLYVNNILVAVIGFAFTDLDLFHKQGEQYTIELWSKA
ncbi:MAG TPA: tRNA lysidine(34) synthetase TilS [Legionellaceae bacterium]|nr:tRNA lysidine(34) synthetase TilS [Legionellaceae bacterium]